MNLDLSSPLLSVFTNGFSFQDAIASLCPSESLIRVATYNIGIHEETKKRVHDFVSALCKAKEVRLLVGINPYHPKNHEIKKELGHLAKENANLAIRTLGAMHVKCILLESFGYVGSLNLISPSLNDLMVQVSGDQNQQVHVYFDSLWNQATQLFSIRF